MSPQTKRREPTCFPAKEAEGTEPSYSWFSPHCAEIQCLIPTITEPDSLSLPDLWHGVILNGTWPQSRHGKPAMLESSSRIEMVSHPFQERLFSPAGRSNQGKNAVKIWHNVTWNKEADRTKGNMQIEAHHKVWRESYNTGSAPVYYRSENLSQSWAKQRVLNWNMSFRKTLQSQTTQISLVNCIQS